VNGSNALTVRWVSRGGRGENKLSVFWTILVAKITNFFIFTPPASPAQESSLEDDGNPFRISLTILGAGIYNHY